MEIYTKPVKLLKYSNMPYCNKKTLSCTEISSEQLCFKGRSFECHLTICFQLEVIYRKMPTS